MLIRISRASDSNIKPCKNAYLVEKNLFENVYIVKIESLDDLIELNKECRAKLIVDFVGKDREKEIIVYDDWIE